MKRISLILLALFTLTAGFSQTQTSSLTKGLIFHLPMSEWSTQPAAAQTSGTLTVGAKYTIGNFVAGDNFTNVGASSNASGVSFVATGTTPTTWSNGSLLRRQTAFGIDKITGSQGTITDAYPVMGKDGSGRRWYELDGVNDYLVIPTIPTSATGTIIWRGKINDFTTDFKRLWAYGDTDANESIRMSVNDTNGTLTALCNIANVLQWSFISNSTFSANQQYTIALVHDGTTPILYVNGVLQTITFTTELDKTKWFSAATGIDNGRLGCSNSNSSGNVNFLNCTISGFQSFNRALSAAEVLAYQNDNTPLTFADRGATNTEIISVAADRDFSSDTGFWTKDAGVTIADGVCHYTAVGNGYTLRKSGLLTVGKLYRVTYTVKNFSAGGIRVIIGSTNGTNRTADGTYTQEILATGTAVLYFSTTTASNTLDIDDISITNIGSTLSLTPAGMNSTYWYDYDHSVSGTVSGATLSIPTASNLGAYAFNGTTSKITYPIMDGATGDRTWMAWVLASATGENSAGRIFGNSKAIFAINSSYQLTFTSDSATVVTSNPTALTAGTWAHVAVTRTASGVANFYINGLLVGTANQASGTPASGTVWVWGNRTAGDRTWDGRIFDGRIYNRIVPVEELLLITQGAK